MNILEQLTKDYQYEENAVNPDLRKVTSGPFRGVTVNRNGFCYSRTGRTMKISSTGFYKSLEGKAVIKPWRLCALVWHDQSPSFHFEDGKDKYLNLLAFLRLSEEYNDYYEKIMNGTSTKYYPLTNSMMFNPLTGCLVRRSTFNSRHPIECNELNWNYFDKISDSMMDFFLSFKVKLKKELTENLGKTNSDTNVDSVENEPEDELEVCLSDPELGGAPSLKPKVKEDHSQSDNSNSKENKVNECEDIPGYDPNLPMEAQESSVLEEIELQGYRKPSPNVAKDHAEAINLVRGVGSDPYYKLHMQACEERRKKDRESIDELQELFDRRAQLKKMLAEIEEKIKEKITDKL